MNSYRTAPSSNHWITAFKIVLLLIALYLSAVILSHVFGWVFMVVFTLIKIGVYLIVGFFLVHFFLKLLFRFDLWNFVLGSRFHH